MIGLPLPVLAVFIIATAVVAGVGGLLLFRRLERGRSPRQNDFIGLIFAQIALLYSVLMAFVVFSVYEGFTDAAGSVTNEAAALVVAYRDTQLFPEPMRGEAQAALRAYANEVMDNEWESHGAVRPHRSRDALNPTWVAYRKYQPTDPVQQAAFDGAQGRLHDLELQRHIRHLASEASLPAVVWWLLVAGGGLVVGISYLFVVERTGIHALQVMFLSASIAGVLVLILALNYPFRGEVHVSRGPFKHALLNFDALDLKVGGEPEPARRETVTVDARQAFTDTGIEIAAGDQIAITATGSVLHNGTDSAGPNGVSERRDLGQSSVIESENHASLIGRIGLAGAPFAVGSDFSHASEASGRLFLGINDREVENNRGAFNVTVVVTKP